jgi:hypothetical protein
MRKKYAGIPLWAILAVGLAGGGLYLYRRKQAAANAAATAASQAPAAADQSTTGQDPFLIAYQAGQADGVSSYQSGVSAGVSVIDSILGMFPGGLEQTQGQSGSAAPSATTTSVPPATPPAKQAANTYPAGTKVGGGKETIQTPMWDPAAQTWLDPTDLGGVYTAGAHTAAGSAYGKGPRGKWTVIAGPGLTFTEVSPTGQHFAESLK